MKLEDARIGMQVTVDGQMYTIEDIDRGWLALRPWSSTGPGVPGKQWPLWHCPVERAVPQWLPTAGRFAGYQGCASCKCLAPIAKFKHAPGCEGAHATAPTGSVAYAGFENAAEMRRALGDD